jgi:peptidyl-prolyl cis-trans isomerase SurA
MTGFDFMTTRLKTANVSWAMRLMASGLFLLVSMQGAVAQSIVVMVNDDPVTSYDVAQRQRFLALSSGLGDRMRKRLKSDRTKEEFQTFMSEHRPQTKEEAEKLKKQFVDKLQKEVVASASSSMRKDAIEQLIEERLMMQAAKDKKVEITDDELNAALTRMAQGGGQKRTLEEFLASFRAQGINPSTLKDRIRAQLAWRDLIRRLYLPLVQSTVSTVGSVASSPNEGTLVDVEIVKLSVPSGGDQKAVAGRLVEADAIRNNFSSCDKLREQLQGKSGVSVQSVKKAGIENFSGDVRAALAKAKPGDMTPPVIKGEVIETHAVCSKTVAAAAKPKQKNAGSEENERQEKLQLYAQRHLKDLRDRALLKYPKSG